MVRGLNICLRDLPATCGNGLRAVAVFACAFLKFVRIKIANYLVVSACYEASVLMSACDRLAGDAEQDAKENCR